MIESPHASLGDDPSGEGVQKTNGRFALGRKNGRHHPLKNVVCEGVFNLEIISGTNFRIRSIFTMSLKLFRYPFKAMGSTCELKFYCPTKTMAEGIASLVMADIERIEKRYSRYRPDSLLSAINHAANRAGSIGIDNETAALMNYADTCYRQSDGLFDITSGVLREAWDFKSDKIPDTAQVRRLLHRIGWEKVAFSSNRISFAVKGMQLDFGGIGKEYAVDRAATICQQQGIEHGLINLGGDIKAIGPHANGRPWSIGVRHPRKTGRLLANIEVGRGGVASSGDYERCIILKGKRYSHILNPKTGWPVRGFASVTVIAEQCVVAGSATTIAMLKETEGKTWLGQLGLAHLWMDQRNEIGGNIQDSARQNQTLID